MTVSPTAVSALIPTVPAPTAAAADAFVAAVAGTGLALAGIATATTASAAAAAVTAACSRVALRGGDDLSLRATCQRTAAVGIIHRDCSCKAMAHQLLGRRLGLRACDTRERRRMAIPPSTWGTHRPWVSWREQALPPALSTETQYRLSKEAEKQGEQIGG